MASTSALLRLMLAMQQLFRLVLCMFVLCLPQIAVAKACPKGTAKDYYEIQDGDVLSAVAARFDTSVADILKQNPKLDANSVRAGQRIAMCVAKSTAKRASGDGTCAAGERQVEHKVTSGEGWDAIAAKYGSSTAALKRQNRKLAKQATLLIDDEVLVCLKKASRRRGAKECGYETPIFEHEVVPGEVMAQIAALYGVRIKDIARINSSLRKNPDLIRVGQKIRVCPDIPPREREKFKHVVKSGDTVTEIAEKYGLTRNELIRFQQGKLDNPNDLRIGQELVVWQDGKIVPGFGVQESGGGGQLKGGLLLTAGKGYTTKAARLSWGTASTLRHITTAVSRYRRAHPKGPKIHIGDISLKSGGKFPPHVSHRNGQDVDIGYVLAGADANTERFLSANSKNIDLAGTWALVKAFLDSGHVRYIFMDYSIQKLLVEYAKKHGTRESLLEELFQYPRGKARHYGIVRHSRGHVNHFHVRFK